MRPKALKVTDRRMFTAEGELREEFREVPVAPEKNTAEPTSAESRGPAARPPERQPLEPSRQNVPPGEAEEERPGVQPPGTASFFDLVGLLAEPASIYLREARNAPPQTAAQSIELARMHIDLLTILQDKTEGNLKHEEKAMLEDVVYQLRSGFVGLRG